MELVAYHVRKVTAEVNHANSSHWVDLTVTEDLGYGGHTKESQITLFFTGKGAAVLAERYADAINRAVPEDAEPVHDPDPTEDEIAF
jgi:hypothetical protein